MFDFICTRCLRRASMNVPLPDHIQSQIRCRACHAHMVRV